MYNIDIHLYHNIDPPSRSFYEQERGEMCSLASTGIYFAKFLAGGEGITAGGKTE